MFDVSIIIVNWNTKELLRKCLNSLFEKNHNVSYEVLVVDNGSSDGSQDMVKKDFPQAHLICNGENLGFAKANNIGIKKAHGKYICFVNSDIIVLEDTIHKLLEFMDMYPRIGIAGPRIVNPDQTFRSSCKRMPSFLAVFAQILKLDMIFPRLQTHMRFEELRTIRDVDVLAGCFWIVRKEAIDEVGGLDEDFFIYSEDVDWCRRFIMAGWRVVHYPYATAIHLGNGSSSLAPIRFYIELQKSSFQYWGKYHGNLSLICYKAIKLTHEFIRINLWIIIYVIRVSEKKKAAFMIERYKASIKWQLFI